MFKNILQPSGFTFIELLLVISLTAVLAAATIPIYGRLELSGQVNDSFFRLEQVLREARENARSGYLGSAFGVYIRPEGASSTEYVLYKGRSYALRDADFDKIYYAPRPLCLETGLLNREVNFSVGEGLPDNTGSIHIYYNNDIKKTLTINSLGILEIE